MSLQEKAVALFSNPHATESQNAHNQAAWLKSVEALGSRWILHSPITLVKKEK